MHDAPIPAALRGPGVTDANQFRNATEHLYRVVQARSSVATSLHATAVGRDGRGRRADSRLHLAPPSRRSYTPTCRQFYSCPNWPFRRPAVDWRATLKGNENT
jgi:hypothetical protein